MSNETDESTALILFGGVEESEAVVESNIVDDLAHGWYTLDADGLPVPATSIFQQDEWVKAHPDESLLRQEDVEYDGHTYWVSTVFLGMDHGWGRYRGYDYEYQPILWETMVFERQTENTHLTSHRIKKDEAGNTVYTTWTDWQGVDRPIAELEEYQLEVGEICYSELFCERYSSRHEALDGHKKAVQWVLDGLKDDDESVE